MTSRSHGPAGGYPGPMAGFDGFLGLSRPPLEAIAQINGRAFEQMQSLNTEWMRFVQYRLQEDAAFARRLADCHSIPDAFGLYTEFFQKAARDYQGEMTSIAKINQEFVAEAASLMREGLADSHKTAAKR